VPKGHDQTLGEFSIFFGLAAVASRHLAHLRPFVASGRHGFADLRPLQVEKTLKTGEKDKNLKKNLEDSTCGGRKSGKIKKGTKDYRKSPARKHFQEWTCGPRNLPQKKIGQKSLWKVFEIENKKSDTRKYR